MILASVRLRTDELKQMQEATTVHTKDLYIFICVQLVEDSPAGVILGTIVWENWPFLRLKGRRANAVAQQPSCN